VETSGAKRISANGFAGSAAVTIENQESRQMPRG
jgi:hypothetical protein